MKEQIKSAIELIKSSRDYRYSHYVFTDEIGEAFDMAIRSLQTWEDVLNELEILIRGCDIMLEDNEDMFYGGKKRAYEKAIEVINQHLAEIEEKEQKNAE